MDSQTRALIQVAVWSDSDRAFKEALARYAMPLLWFKRERDGKGDNLLRREDLSNGRDRL